MCETVQGLGIIYHSHRSDDITVGIAYGEKLENSGCIYCGQCTTVCPVGALYEKDNTQDVWDVINKP